MYVADYAFFMPCCDLDDAPIGDRKHQIVIPRLILGETREFSERRKDRVLGRDDETR